VKLSSDGRYVSLRGAFERLDKQRLRAHVHALLPLLADRRAFDLAAVDVSHATLVDLGARYVVKAELVASFRSVEPPSGDRVSGVISRIVPSRTGT